MMKIWRIFGQSSILPNFSSAKVSLHTVSNWLSDGQYLSYKITDELIGMMAYVYKVCRHILSEVCTAEWFGIIGDET